MTMLTGHPAAFIMRAMQLGLLLAKAMASSGSNTVSWKLDDFGRQRSRLRPAAIAPRFSCC